MLIARWRYKASLIMATITVNDLALAAENEFAFLESLGFPLTEWSEISPESFKGGFKLIFRNSSGTKVTILYTDYEFQVRAGSTEIFGATKHESFAGNMFSREHLIPALPKLRAAVEPALRSFAAAAT
jgi:hypothetical protein